MRIVKSNSWKAFDIAKEHSLWGNKKKRFSKWEPGELLVMFVEDDGLAVGKITGKQFESDEVFWEDDLYPWRIPVEFHSVEKGEKGKHLQQKIREFLKNEYGSRYGTVILFGMKIHEEDEKELIELMRNEGVLNL